MGKIKTPNTNAKSNLENLEKLEFEIKKEAFKESKRVNKRKEQSMRLDTRDRNRTHLSKCISKAIATIFAIFLGFIAILNYANNIPNPLEIKIGIPLFSSFICDFPKNITGFLKKSPP